MGVAGRGVCVAVPAVHGRLPVATVADPAEEDEPRKPELPADDMEDSRGDDRERDSLGVELLEAVVRVGLATAQCASAAECCHDSCHVTSYMPILSALVGFTSLVNLSSP